ncbi:transcriptional regulator [Mycolicibacterium mageritense DSM 44476 = CIP 104973]|uniref:GntR family transcriptional regulator n=1 Tax=Mycolicibacterium mageritense TaxID=53462 RepID=A0ABM7I2E7_MYCME|nr:PLP-dependent aminotransferase family protein [Mycolicibacterium mageritense]MBN3454454.1 PLP-dependent aminotransferase family protein [Mycobacterium sp. DSM 3803]OKH69924.1 GntR family transcriptional regulator [Mycobacterium sp. SWH-M3]MCC9181707.1 PLP-dependent aminotransferase family protein [Mycolicibacterium mageritense]TXI63026.1 MAG: PLP-dependent aminotransferase family protein [Mycolicibacterium mageritense]CDO26689.1 GntR family transcriptional regulator [Mycolicibacterium mager
MTVSGTTSGPELLVELDRARREPLHRQLTDGLREAIRSGRLAAGVRLPSSRVLASDLGVSRRMVVDAYAQLVAEGFLVSQTGAGTYVATVEVATTAAPEDASPVADYTVDFSPGMPDVHSFPRAEWLRALRQGLADLPSKSFGYTEPQGLTITRQALADYLRRTRAVDADPARIVLCSGATQAVGLVARVLRDTGDASAAVEDPGFWLHRHVLRHHGIDPVPVPVDECGLVVDALAAGSVSTVLTTPAHQSPTGVVMTAGRRAELLDWARAGNLVIEDDYDAEYRYERRPVGALQSLAPDRVIYVGSVSKTLAPGLRLGWMVVPDDLAKAVRRAKGLADVGNSVMDQVAFAQLLQSGGYDRHLRQMRRRYVARRNTLLAALARYLPQVTVLGAAAGVQLMAQFPDGCDVDAVVRAAATLGVRVESARPCYVDRESAPPTLFLGYANLTETQIVTGIRLLARCCGEPS